MSPTCPTKIDGLWACEFKHRTLIGGQGGWGEGDYDRILSKIVQGKIQDCGGEAKYIAKQGVLRLAQKLLLTLSDKFFFFKAIGLSRQKWW